LPAFNIPGVRLGAPPAEAVRRLPSGIAALDTLLGGGLPRGHLSEIVGGLSSGRTALLHAWLVGNERVEECGILEIDAIVVLGGGPATRPFVAAKLFNDGYAPRVLVMNNERSPTDELGVTTPDLDLNRRVLRALKVPDSAVVGVGRKVSSTYEEALAVRE
jgi:RecA/RadA recombinase